MASNELEDFPQAVCVLRQIAEEIGLNSIERDHDLTRMSSATAGGSELSQYPRLFHESKAGPPNGQRLAGAIC
jgi:hypothetical protein